MRLQALLGLPRALLQVGKLRFLLRQRALKLHDLRLRIERVALILVELAGQRFRPGALDILVLREREHILLHPGDLRAHDAQLALSRFLLARELQHALMRLRDLRLHALRLFVRLLAQRAQLRRAAFLLGDGIVQAVHHLLGVGDAFLGAVMAQHERRAVERAQLVAQGQIASGRLARLRKRLQLAIQLRDDVLHAGEIVAHVRQALFALLLAGAVLDDARGLLKDVAPVLALLRENLVDPALADDRVALLAHAGVAEQLHDVAQAAGRLVDVVFALTAAVDAAGDHHLGEVHCQRVVLVVEDEGHLAVAKPLALLRAVEDDILHLAAAQRLGALLAQHPAHGVRQIRLAAAVGADDARDALVKLHDGPVRKRLEAVDFQSL